MVTTLDDTKRMMIGERLADLRRFQELIISSTQKLIAACSDSDVRDRLQTMLKDDQKNLGIIDTVIVQYGIPSEPSPATQIFTQQLSGIAGSVITQNTDKQDINIQTLIRLDHNKVNTIFTEIGATKDPQKLQEYLGQLYKDLLAHAQAEEEVIYPKVQSFYGADNTQDLYSEQAEIKQMLDQIKALDPNSADQFRSKVKDLMNVVGDHSAETSSESAG